MNRDKIVDTLLTLAGGIWLIAIVARNLGFILASTLPIRVASVLLSAVLTIMMMMVLERDGDELL